MGNIMKKKQIPKVKWLDGNSADLRWMADLYQIDFVEEFKKCHVRNHDTDWWSQADKNDLLTVIHEQHKLLSKLEFLFRDAGQNATIKDHYAAQIAAEHWNSLKQFLADNPAMQSEWDNFLMAMRLTQE